MQIKVAEHSFQVPMPNSITFKLFMLWRPFFARVKVNHVRVYSRIFAIMCAVAMATGLVKNKALIMVFVYLIKFQSLDSFNHLLTTN